MDGCLNFVARDTEATGHGHCFQQNGSAEKLKDAEPALQQ